MSAQSRADQALIDNIRYQLKRWNVSITRFAREAGMTRTVLSRILNGHQPPRLDTAAKLADALGMEVWELYKPREEQ